MIFKAETILLYAEISDSVFRFFPAFLRSGWNLMFPLPKIPRF